MTCKHTKEKWWAEGPFVYGEGAGSVVRIADTIAADGDLDYISDVESEANAVRIADCVNGCRGIEDPAVTVLELVRIAQEVYQRMRDGYGHTSTLSLAELRRIINRLDV